MSTDKMLLFRGELRAVLGRGGDLVFVTTHPEGQATAVYTVDLAKLELAEEALPCGAVDLVHDGDALFVAGVDGHVYKLGGRGGAKALGKALSPAPAALALCGDDRLAALSGDALVILARKDGKELQRLPLGELGTAVASDPGRTWLAVGGERGTLFAFDGEGASVVASDRKKVHEGPIQALLFEPEELRVLSGGVDGRIFLTHVRGALDPEDRSGKQNHAAAVTCLSHGPGDKSDKTYSGSKDGTVRVWTRGNWRPSTLKDGVVNPVAMTTVEHNGRPHLALACEDRTLRLFICDAAGKPENRTLTLHGAAAWAGAELGHRDPKVREAAIKVVATWNDAAGIDLLGRAAKGDGDHRLKVLATELLGKSGQQRAVKPLEELLKAGEEAVRLAAFAGLRAIEGDANLRPLNLALAAKKRDIGVAAVKALATLAAKDDLALDRLVQALGEDPREVRIAGLLALESLHPADSPEAELTALRAQKPDVRRLAIVRFLQRGLIDRPDVLAALRRHAADDDAAVRQAAFLVTLLQRPTLAAALRYHDRDIHRLLHELETTPVPTYEASAKGEEPKKEAGAPPKAKKVEPSAVGEDDRRPLLEAMASRALDTCLQGATGLAMLGDPRALGTLLQLSRESDAKVRVEVCKALAELGDPRGAARLRMLMRDKEASVRDAAFTAIAALDKAQPLAVVEAGLLAEHEDVRRRGLELLVRHLKAAKKGDKGEGAIDVAAATALLERALGDSARAVRSEAFKAVLALAIDGGGAGALRFALRSLHADIRKEALGEVLGQIEEPWAWPLLLAIFADPDPQVRAEAFEFAMKRTKGIGLEPLQAALAGPYPDLRVEATKILGKRKAPGIHELLVKAVDDQDEAVRQLAVDALLVNEADDALTDAMASRHPDVVVRAAGARAVHGDPRALAPLTAIVSAAEPEIPALQIKWKDQLVKACEGLAELSDPSARSCLVPRLQHKDAQVRKAAARALAWSTRPGDADGQAALMAALQHTDAAVRVEAALGLAYVGDPAGASLLFASGQKADLQATMLAALALGERASEVFMAFLDHGDEKVRDRTLLLLLLMEMVEDDGTPDRCLAALASQHPRIRLGAAQALETFGDPKAFADAVVVAVNDRGEGKAAWTIADATVRALAELVTHGDGDRSPQMRVRAAGLLTALDADKQEEFDRRWRIFSERHKAALAAAQKRGAARKPAKPAYSPDELRQVVFGAYAGLSRLAGGQTEAKIRQTAIARLVAVAERGWVPRPAVHAVLVPALGDAQQSVRTQAFESLKALGMETAALATEAVACGQRDIGGLGLELLARSGGAKAGLKVLEDVLRNGSDGLEEEAARLLAALRSGVRTGDGVVLSDDERKKLDAAWIAVNTVGLEARAETRRLESVGGLAGAYEASGKGPAADALRGALTSRYRKVRLLAAEHLAGRGDVAAFPVLVEMLASDQAPEQTKAVGLLKRLGDARTPGALMDRVDRDPGGTARAADLLKAAGSLRLAASADRLLGYLTEPKHRDAAFEAVLAVSGHDQKIEDPEDEGKGTPGWEEKQHRRDDALLARLVTALYNLGDDKLLPRLMPAATWARGNQVDAALTPLCAHSKPELRQAAITALSWRIRKRKADPAPLVAAVQSADPQAQFLAAEGLALAGREAGISVLLAGVELLPELAHRQRAVKALGVLADLRALDLLLRLANDEGHALQEQAAEALGHMGKSAPDRADKIFELLARLAKGTMTGVAAQALTGLRYFGTRAAWALIREQAASNDATLRLRAVELLRHDGDPASKELLADKIRKDGNRRVVVAAAQGLRHIHGEASLEPDYIYLESPQVPPDQLQSDIAQRVRERGEPSRILDILPRIKQGALFATLVAILTARVDLPVAAAAGALQSPHEITVTVAARILGSAGAAIAGEHGKALAAATDKWAKAWSDELALLTGAGVAAPTEDDDDDDDDYSDDDDDDDDDDDYSDDDDDDDSSDDDDDDDGPTHTANFGVGTGKLGALTAPYVRLLWACGRVGVGDKAILAAVGAGGDDPRGRPIRRAAVIALAQQPGDLGKAAREGLVALARGGNAELRALAASALAARDRKQAAALVPALLDDGIALARVVDPGLAADARRALEQAALSAHHQGVALPHLVALGDAKALAKLLDDKKLGEGIRLGIIEALAKIATKEAQDRLVVLGTDKGEDEDLRKAAWRALRRAKRRLAAATRAPRRSRWEVQP